MVHEEPEPLKALRPGAAPELRQAVARALKKKREARYASAEEFGKDLRKYLDGLKAAPVKAFGLKAFLRALRRPAVAVPAAVAVAAIAIAAARHFDRQAKVRWARAVALPEARALVQGSLKGYVEAYGLGSKGRKIHPGRSRAGQAPQVNAPSP